MLWPTHTSLHRGTAGRFGWIWKSRELISSRPSHRRLVIHPERNNRSHGLRTCVHSRHGRQAFGGVSDTRSRREESANTFDHVLTLASPRPDGDTVVFDLRR
jgi:hypothetical protein